VPFPTEHIIDGEVNHGRVDNPTSHTTERLNINDINISPLWKTTKKLAIGFNTRGMQVNFAPAPNHIKQLQTHRACKSLVNQLKRWHPSTKDAVHLVKHGSFRFTRCLQHILAEVLLGRIA
jgi:hypothetical protein